MTYHSCFSALGPTFLTKLTLMSQELGRKAGNTRSHRIMSCGWDLGQFSVKFTYSLNEE